MIRTREITAEVAVPPKVYDKEDQARVQLVTSKAWVQRVNEWRATQPGFPNMSEAVRRLVEMGLETEAKKKR